MPYKDPEKAREAKRRIGSPLDPSDVSRTFQEFLRRHELPKVRFHDLRHSCGSILLAEGVPLKVIQEILGHSTMATTAKVYAHVLPELHDLAADAMARALNG